jgi:hypothetical protein
MLTAATNTHSSHVIGVYPAINHMKNLRETAGDQTRCDNSRNNHRYQTPLLHISGENDVTGIGGPRRMMLQKGTNSLNPIIKRHASQNRTSLLSGGHDAK